MESAGSRTALYPPCTRRVQPPLPNSAFTTIVTSRSGATSRAWIAASKPAPPPPRINRSVSRTSQVPIISPSSGTARVAEQLIQLLFRQRFHLKVEIASVRIDAYLKRPQIFHSKLPEAFGH